MPYTIDIKVTDPDGQEATASASFSFVPAPVITSVQPSSGPQAGGTTVTLTGSNFQAGAVVKFGGVPATNVQVSSDGLTLTCVTPPYTP